MTDTSHTSSTYDASYTYTVPEEITPSGGIVNLAVTANDVSNNSGFDTQVCAQGPFKLAASSGTDPCAHAFAKTPGSSDTGSKDLTLLPSGVAPTQLCPNSGPGSPAECVTLTIELGGPNLYFTYRASPAPKVQHAFQASLSSSFETRRTRSGSGDFQLTESAPPPLGCTPGINDRGSVELRFHRAAGVHAVELTSFAAAYCTLLGGTERLELLYRVVKSTISCLPVGATAHFQVFRSGSVVGVHAQFCALDPSIKE